MTPRRSWFVHKLVHADGGTPAARPVSRVAVALAVANPYAETTAHDLSLLVDAGPALAQAWLPEAVALLACPPRAYGNAAIVGIAGEVEHGAALLHPRLGGAMRAAVGRGEALIPSTCKMAAAGARIAVPLGHKDDS